MGTGKGIRTYVTDTSVLITNPDVVYTLAGVVVVPAAVIREIDGLKRSDKEEVAKAARKIARLLDRLGSRGNIAEGVNLNSVVRIRVVTSSRPIDGLSSERDNRIVGTAVALRDMGEDVVLLTTDTNMRTIARAYGITAESCECEEQVPLTPMSTRYSRRGDPARPSGRFNCGLWGYRLKIVFFSAVIIVLGLVAWEQSIDYRAKKHKDGMNLAETSNKNDSGGTAIGKQLRQLGIPEKQSGNRKRGVTESVKVSYLKAQREEIYNRELPYAAGTAVAVGLIGVFLLYRSRNRGMRKITLDSDNIKAVIIGQDAPIEELMKSLASSSTSPMRGVRPRFIGAVVGATGVGKTELVKVFSEQAGLPLHIFNMADYVGDSGRDAAAAHWRLFGSAPGYVDGDVDGEFIAAIKKNPSCVILLDEIEKANKKIFDTFLTAFQEGAIKDNRGGSHSITNTFIFCTSNLCHTTPPDTSETALRKILAEEGLRPEFIGRFDKVVLFRPLTGESAKRILANEIRKRFSGDVVMDSAPTLLLLQKYGFEDGGVRAIHRLIAEEGIEDIPRGITKIHITDKAGEGAGVRYIAISSFTTDDVEALKRLPDALKDTVLGQEAAVSAVVNKLRANAIGATLKPSRPLGVFLFAGPSGVGKTELAKTVAAVTGRSFIRFDMADFKEATSAQRFFGPPPGYAGSDKGGQLTQEVLRKPASVVLLDEAEKAHPAIWDTFLSVADDGILKDASTGTVVSFKETIIFITSNISITGPDSRASLAEGGYFRSEFVNRLDEVVVFNLIDYDNAKIITRKKLDALLDSVHERTKVRVRYTGDEVVDVIMKNADFNRFGARNIEKAMESMVSKVIFEHIGNGIKKLTIGASTDGSSIQVLEEGDVSEGSRGG